MSAPITQPVATFRVGEKGRVNLPAHLRELANIRQGDLLVVTRVTDGEVTIRTPAAIREYIHSGIVDGAPGVVVAEWRREDDASARAALTRKLDAEHPDAGEILLRTLGL